MAQPTRVAVTCVAGLWVAMAVLAGAEQQSTAQQSAGQQRAAQQSAGQQRAARTVWDGVFTEVQARRGQAAYAESCAACHADDLRGRSTAPSLVEESFAFLWGDMTVGELFSRTQTKMPSDKPASLPATTYADIVAYVLQKNGFPAGATELAATQGALDSIVISTTRPAGH
jgi:mono/diheme cytochrome c family protein